MKVFVETNSSSHFEERQIPLDLLIVDEAHHMRNAGTRTYQLGNTLTDSADAAVFLTATPLQLHQRNLFNLLEMLAPEEFPEFQLFDDIVGPNSHITRANRMVAEGELCDALESIRQVETMRLSQQFIRNPLYQDVVQRLREACNSINDQSISSKVELQRDVLELNTLSQYLTRTRKREVRDAAVRAPSNIRVQLSSEERRLYDRILDSARVEIDQDLGKSSGFAGVMRERQAASCLPAVAHSIRESSWHQSDVWKSLEQSEYIEADRDSFDKKLENAPLREAANVRNLDSKYVVFEDALEKAFGENPDSKILVFSFFKSTLRYLDQRLRSKGLIPALISGDVGMADRAARIEAFRNDPSIRVMLSSEVGAEGLDFEFCDVLINYDLPWNPMQLQQRIGRLDRFNQKHKRIRILNLFIEDTIEARVLERLYQRIQLFEQSIGDLEGILGEEITIITRKAIQRELTNEELDFRLEQLAARVVRERLETDYFETNKDRLLSHEQLFDHIVTETLENGRYVSGDEVRALVVTFLASRFSDAKILFDDEEPCGLLEAAGHFRRDTGLFLEGNRLTRSISDQFRQFLGDSQIRLPITFDSDLANQRPLLEFITVTHPITRMALEYWSENESSGVPASQIQMIGTPSECGAGYFYVYLLSIEGAARHVSLEAVVVLDNGQIAPKVGESVLRAIQQNSPIPNDLGYDSNAFIEIEELIASREIAKRRHHLESNLKMRNIAQVEARIASTEASFEAKIERTERQAREASDPRIRRMRESQIKNLQTKKTVKLREINANRQITPSSKLIAGGRILIEPAHAEIDPVVVMA